METTDADKSPVVALFIPEVLHRPQPLEHAIVAECRQCLFRSEANDHRELSAIEYRAEYHEQTNPGHVVTTRVERD